MPAGPAGTVRMPDTAARVGMRGLLVRGAAYKDQHDFVVHGLVQGLFNGQRTVDVQAISTGG